MASVVCESHNVFIFWNIDASSFDLFSITWTVCHGLCGSLQLYDIKQKLLRIGVTSYNLVSSQSKKPILLPQNDSFIWASSLVCFLLLYSSLTCDFIYHTWMHYALPRISEALTPMQTSSFSSTSVTSSLDRRYSPLSSVP